MSKLKLLNIDAFYLLLIISFTFNINLELLIIKIESTILYLCSRFLDKFAICLQM